MGATLTTSPMVHFGKKHPIKELKNLLFMPLMVEAELRKLTKQCVFYISSLLEL